MLSLQFDALPVCGIKKDPPRDLHVLVGTSKTELSVPVVNPVNTQTALSVKYEF